MIYGEQKCESYALVVHAKCQVQLCYMPGNPVMTHFNSRQEPNVLGCPVSKKKEVSHLVYKTDDSPKSPLALQYHCSQVIIKPSTFNLYTTLAAMFGKIVHFTADAVLVSTVLAGIKRSTGLQ